MHTAYFHCDCIRKKKRNLTFSAIQVGGGRERSKCSGQITGVQHVTHTGPRRTSNQKAEGAGWQMDCLERWQATGLVNELPRMKENTV